MNSNTLRDDVYIHVHSKIDNTDMQIENKNQFIIESVL